MKFVNGNLYLTGFMGAGKSTVGRLLADTLGWRFFDFDEVLTRRLGMPVPEVFEALGQETFRRAETEELGRVSRRHGLVAAAGGGLPTRVENRRLMRASGRVIHLAASLKECRHRLGVEGHEHRPLWKSPEAVEKLFHERREAYGDCNLAVAVDGQAPERVVEVISEWLFADEEFVLSLDGVESPVISTFTGPRALSRFTEDRRVVVICDRNLALLHLNRYRHVVDEPLVITLPPGERMKSLTSAGRLYRTMLDARIERGDLLVALGGGVVTDLGAFVAATYKRGIDFILVSTSLLGCVDAAIGGKAAVNVGPVKNSVGAFTRPKGVILDLRALTTLSRRHLAEGLVEAYKTGLVAAPDLALFVEQGMKRLLGGDLPALAQVVRLSANAKAQVVANDFQESGQRRILNLGHTYGHAVEASNRYRVSHGRAVAIGIMVATALSAGRGFLSDELAGKITETLRPLAPPQTRWPDIREAWEVMLHDKKNRMGQVLFVLLKEPGRTVCVSDVSSDELERSLKRVRGD